MVELVTFVHLARHGETVWHAENRYAGSSDIALTELGMQQAELLGDWAAARDLAAVYSSDLSRAVATAGPAAAASGTSLVVVPTLREVDFGAAEGLTARELTERYPAERAAFEAAPASSPFPGGESGLQAIERAWPALVEISEKPGHHEVLVVMHSTLMRLLLCTSLGIDPNRYRAVFPSVLNVGITTLRVEKSHTALIRFNTAVGG